MPSFLQAVYSTRTAVHLVLPLLASLAQLAAADEHKLPRASQWHITETVNFRLLNYGVSAAPAELAQRLERLRDSLGSNWLPEESLSPWNPKCHVVFHPTESSYLREVGPAGRQTAASALVDRNGSVIHLRRIDIRPRNGHWDEGAVAHELSHVVLADHFGQQRLPRWIDEGMAILADDDAKRRSHWDRSAAALASGAHFRLPELFALVEYPAPARWGIFYDQSGALVEFLVARGGHAQFVAFVDLALVQGYAHAVHASYGVTVDQLEQQWRRALGSKSGNRGNVNALSRVTSAASPPQG